MRFSIQLSEAARVSPSRPPATDRSALRPSDQWPHLLGLCWFKPLLMQSAVESHWLLSDGRESTWGHLGLTPRCLHIHEVGYLWSLTCV